MFRHEFIKHDGRLFILKQKVKEEYNPNVEIWKQHTGADAVLKKDGILYFVELVPDLEILPDQSDLEAQ